MTPSGETTALTLTSSPAGQTEQTSHRRSVLSWPDSLSVSAHIK